MKIDFDPDRHLYFMDGNPVPGTSDLLERAGYSDYSKVPEESRRRCKIIGSHVASLTELYDQGRLNESALDPELKPYLKAYKLFHAEHNPEWMMIERLVGYNAGHKFVTILDRLGTIGGHSRYFALIEIKTGQAQDWHGIQLALQAACLMGLKIAGFRLLGLYLRPNGRYAIKDYSGEFLSNYSKGIAALTIYK